VAPDRGSARHLQWLLVACAAATVTVACITLLFLGMRDVMDVGGRCVSGNTPFEIRQECPDGTAAVVLGSFLGVVTALIWAGAASYLPAARRFVLLAWPGLFLALGYNFFDYGFNPPDGFGPGTEWANVGLGVMFAVMGGGPLLALLSPDLRRAAFGTAPPPSPPAQTQTLAQFIDGASGTIQVNEHTPTSIDLSGFMGSGVNVGGIPLDDLINRALADGNVSSTGFTTVHVNEGPGGTSVLASDLAALADLHQRGVLTDEQFEAAKTARIAKESSS
jgi:hypothetical protein